MVLVKYKNKVIVRDFHNTPVWMNVRRNSNKKRYKMKEYFFYVKSFQDEIENKQEKKISVDFYWDVFELVDIY